MATTLILTNNFGEETENVVGDGSTFVGGTIAANSMVANFTASPAIPVAVTNQAVANKLPAKAGVTAISALSGGAVLADVIAAYNSLLAALKVSS